MGDLVRGLALDARLQVQNVTTLFLEGLCRDAERRTCLDVPLLQNVATGFVLGVLKGFRGPAL